MKSSLHAGPPALRVRPRMHMRFRNHNKLKMRIPWETVLASRPKISYKWELTLGGGSGDIESRAPAKRMKELNQ